MAKLFMDKVSDWLFLADNDFKTARAALKENITNTACFHAHQTAEKALKAILLSSNQEIPRVHDLLFLLEKVLQHQKAMLDYKSACQFLNNFYISTRYPDAIPGELPEGLPTLEIAKQAVGYAEKILNFVKQIADGMEQKGHGHE